MPAFLTCSLVLSFYLMSLLALEHSSYVRVSSSKMALLLAPVALVVLGVVTLCAFSTNTWDDVLLLFAFLAPIAAVILAARGMRRHRSDMNLIALALFILFMLALGYVTLFSRDGTSSTRVLFQLRNITRAIQTGSVLYLKHLTMNIILFVPFGLLLAACCPGRSDRVIVVITYALMLCASIEAIQYLFAIGECDLEDILGNVLGAWAGLGLYKLYRLTQ